VSLDEWVQIFIAVGTVCAALLAYFAIRRETRKDTAVSGETRIRELARAEDEPLKSLIHDHANRMTQSDERMNNVVRLLNSIDDKQDNMIERLVAVETKMGLYWESVAINAAKQLHQPDPLREPVDHLLEAFMEGTLTEDERLKLKKYLVKIRNWETKENAEDDRRLAVAQLGFPVIPGEQTAAAILLGTMDLVDPSRIAATGHVLHRNHANTDPTTGSLDPGVENE
jgi:hypothetical protein